MTSGYLVSPRYAQYGIDGAHHVLDGAEGFLVDAVRGRRRTIEAAGQPIIAGAGAEMGR